MLTKNGGRNNVVNDKDDFRGGRRCAVRNCRGPGKQSREAPPNEAFPHSKGASGQHFEGAVDGNRRFTHGGRFLPRRRAFTRTPSPLSLSVGSTVKLQRLWRSPWSL